MEGRYGGGRAWVMLKGRSGREIWSNKLDTLLTYDIFREQKDIIKWNHKCNLQHLWIKGEIPPHQYFNGHGNSCPVEDYFNFETDPVNL